MIGSCIGCIQYSILYWDVRTLLTKCTNAFHTGLKWCCQWCSTAGIQTMCITGGGGGAKIAPRCSRIKGVWKTLLYHNPQQLMGLVTWILWQLETYAVLIGIMEGGLLSLLHTVSLALVNYVSNLDVDLMNTYSSNVVSKEILQNGHKSK